MVCTRCGGKTATHLYAGIAGCSEHIVELAQKCDMIYAKDPYYQKYHRKAVTDVLLAYEIMKRVPMNILVDQGGANA